MGVGLTVREGVDEQTYRDVWSERSDERATET